MYTLGPADATEQALIDFVMSPEMHQRLPKFGLVPVAEMRVSRDRD
jgi:hypothetical protein